MIRCGLSESTVGAAPFRSFMFGVTCKACSVYRNIHSGNNSKDSQLTSDMDAPSEPISSHTLFPWPPVLLLKTLINTKLYSNQSSEQIQWSLFTCYICKILKVPLALKLNRSNWADEESKSLESPVTTCVCTTKSRRCVSLYFKDCIFISFAVRFVVQTIKYLCSDSLI